MVLARAPRTLAMPTGGTQSISTVSVGIARESKLELTCDSCLGAARASPARGGTHIGSSVMVGVAVLGSHLKLISGSRPGAEHAGHARGGTQSGSATIVGIAFWNRFLMNLAAVFVFIETCCCSFLVNETFRSVSRYKAI